MTTQRVTRLGELLREELGELIHDELKDPRIGFVTVTAVEVSPDIRHAQVHLSIMGTGKEREKTLAGIKSAQGHLRKELGGRVRLKYTPELHFHLDDSLEKAAHLERVIHKLKTKGRLPEDES